MRTQHYYVIAIVTSLFLCLTAGASPPLGHDIPDVYNMGPVLAAIDAAPFGTVYSSVYVPPRRTVVIYTLPPRKAYNLLQWGFRAPWGTFGLQPAHWERE